MPAPYVEALGKDKQERLSSHAEAIAEAVGRPKMRLYRSKSDDQRIYSP